MQEVQGTICSSLIEKNRRMLEIIPNLEILLLLEVARRMKLPGIERETSRSSLMAVTNLETETVTGRNLRVEIIARIMTKMTSGTLLDMPKKILSPIEIGNLTRINPGTSTETIMTTGEMMTEIRGWEAIGPTILNEMFLMSPAEDRREDMEANSEEEKPDLVEAEVVSSTRVLTMTTTSLTKRMDIRETTEVAEVNDKSTWSPRNKTIGAVADEVYRCKCQAGRM